MTIESALLDLGSAIDYPPTPDFDTSQSKRRAPPWWAVAAAIIALALVTTLVPAVRERLTAWLGITGVTIERTQTVDPIEQLSSDVSLGDPTALEDAPISFTPVMLPALGDPQGVFVDEAGRLTIAYLENGDVFLLTQFVGDLEPAILKQVGAEAEVELVEVNGEPAIWIGAGPHVVFFVGADGTVAEDRGWRAGPTLLWEVGEVALRLEGAATRERAVALAESVDQ